VLELVLRDPSIRELLCVYQLDLQSKALIHESFKRLQESVLEVEEEGVVQVTQVQFQVTEVFQKVLVGEVQLFFLLFLLEQYKSQEQAQDKQGLQLQQFSLLQRVPKCTRPRE